MLYRLLYPLHTHFSALNVTRYITFRTAAASLTALVISLALGPWLIRKLREFQIGQVIRQEGPTTHRPKAGTPTMGGLLILTAALVPTLLWADLANLYVWIAVLTTVAFGAVGFADDYLKIVRRSHHGLWPRYKMLYQVLIAAAVGAGLLVLAHQGAYNTRLVFPFFKRLIPDLGVLYLPFAVFVLVAESNAAVHWVRNVGIKWEPLKEHAKIGGKRYFERGIAIHVAGGGIGQLEQWRRIAESRGIEIRFQSPVCAIHGDLRRVEGVAVSTPDGRYDMGDVGSLALGAALGTVAILIKQELLLVIVGGVFVLEALSVIIQVASFKLTGQRVFKMAPLHHHFELIGWSEPKVIARFVIVAIIFALFSLTTLKLR